MSSGQMRGVVRAALVLVVLVAAIRLIVGRRDPVAEGPGPNGPSPSARNAVATMPRPAAGPLESLPEAETETDLANPDEIRAEAVDRARHARALYADTMTYPRWSRPADGSTRHLIDWNKPWPVGQPFAADRDRREIHAELTLDKMFAGPDEAFQATLAVYRPGNGAREPYPPDRATGRVQYLDVDEGRWLVAAEVPLTRAGDVWTGSFTPATIARLAQKPREASFVAEVHVGEFFKYLTVGFRYAARAPFIVHRVAGDRVAGGSLEIDLEVEVLHVAPTLVQAGLFDAAGERAIAVHDDYFRPTRPGRQIATIRFFGKAIADAGIDGPYRLRALHGLVYRPDQDPAEVFWSFPDDLAATTGPHRASAFSGAAWSSAERETKLEQYQDLILELEGRGGDPAP